MMAIDESLRVSGWDTHMAEMSGLSFEEVRGKKCWTVLSGIGVAGNPGCHAECELAQGALRGDHQPTVRMLVPCDTETCDALVATSTVWLEGGASILHLVFAFGTRGEAANEVLPLTLRQRQVLQLLAAGLSTERIARELGITRNTVRNHIRAILLELRSTSRLAAVSEGRRLGLLD
jgi:DNA-binding CsgD family transcriptional regulator